MIKISPLVSFWAANVNFFPGRVYYVTQAIYDSTLSDGSLFSTRVRKIG